MADQPFTHLDGEGKLRMVDVTSKEPTLRTAQATCTVRTEVDVVSLGPGQNGFEPIFTARLAGIQAAKRTSSLIPLCHPINLNDVQVEAAIHPHGVEFNSKVVTVNRTGVEMEALTACAFAALSLVSSLFALDTTVCFEDLVLLRKSGGRSGDWGRLVQPTTDDN
jgi:cyclic pyranopterin phosphate synthase